MNREKRELEAIGDADLVIDVPEVVLNHLLGSSKLRRNFFVLESLNDEGNDAQLFGSEAIANAGADDVVLGGFGGGSGVLHPGFAARDFAYAFNQRRAAHVAEDYAADAELQVLRAVVAAFDDDDQARLDLLRCFNELANVHAHGRGEDEDVGAEALQRDHHAVSVFALRDDAEIVFDGQHLGGAGAEYGLAIGQNNLKHWLSGDSSPTSFFFPTVCGRAK